MARTTGVSTGEAADQVDRLVTELLKRIRDGESATLPGIGRFRRNDEGAIEFVKEQG